jgi:hypothetical protein
MNGIANFRISVGDDSEHEDLNAEIYFKEEYLALVSQEDGFQKSVIQIQSRPNGEAWLFPLFDFMEAIEIAKQRLWDLRRS